MKGNKNMNEKNFNTFADEISAEFGSVFGPGWMPRDYEKIENDVRSKRDVKKKKKKSMNDFIALSRENHTLGNPEIKKYIDEYIDEYGTALRDYNKALKSLTTGEVFGSKIAFESSNYIPCDSELSLADLYGIRYKTDGKAPRVVFENYTDESKAGVIAEGSTIPKISAIDCVGSFSGSLDKIDKLACIEIAPESYLADDPVLAYNMVDRLRFKHIANAENYILCAKILGSKEAVSLASASDLLTLPALSAKARRGAEIITNETGFAKLDISDPVSGETYIKKNFQIGEFVYRDRYIIRVLPDSILANNENETAPVLLGDWKNILRLAVIRERFATNKDMFKFEDQTATICREVPILTTTSDKAYFVGAIA